MNNSELEKVKEYFKALSGVESAVGGFYALCFEYWPEEELWGNLALEEKRHSETVLAMLALAEARPENFALLKPLPLKPLSLFIEGIQAAAAKVRSGAYRKVQALAFSLDLEKTLVEARYDTLLRTEDQEYRMAVDGIKQDTGRHAKSFSARINTLNIIK